MPFHVDTRDLPRGKHEFGENEPIVYDDDQFVFADSACLFPQILRSPDALQAELAEFVDDLNGGDIVKVWLWRYEDGDRHMEPLVVERADNGWCVRSLDYTAIYAAGVR
ncbi:hypothetical protein PP613_26060 [Mycobacteroides abscessus]|nr:hypothetical protein [Mycobacteroides abscessus]MDM2412815.1 hypothetical protein [Mycobacteroides abscessus]